MGHTEYNLHCIGKPHRATLRAKGILAQECHSVRVSPERLEKLARQWQTIVARAADNQRRRDARARDAA